MSRDWTNSFRTKTDEIVKFSILDQKTEIRNFVQTLEEKWPTDCLGTDFVGPEVLKHAQYFYLGLATYLTIICMQNSYFTNIPVL